MTAARRSAPAVACALLCGLTLAGCGDDGLDGKIADYDTVTVWSGGGTSAHEVGELTVLAPVTVKCHTDGWYKVSYDGGSGWIDSSTSIISKKGEVAPHMVPEC
ncbi:SH3 domain-containing protein [Streptomyces sp. NPDC047017]|uniref:SH3 domain-containing protein n=1 Tax=Streptomyces sp. NPDC047017 TaxID=3155024 RepID=UPI0033FD3BA5